MKKQKQSHIEKVKRRQEEAGRLAGIRLDNERRLRQEKSAKASEIRKLVNCLAKEICRRDPRYVDALKMNQFKGLFSTLISWGQHSRMPGFPVLSDIEHSTLIDTEVIEGEYEILR
jgi:hypothetical protein